MTNSSYLPVLTTIANTFKTNPSSYERKRLNAKTGKYFIEKGYLVTVKSLSSRLEIINYFNKLSLASSKRMDYLDWQKAHEIVKARSYRTKEGNNYF